MEDDVKTEISLVDRARGIHVLWWLPRRTTYSAIRTVQERFFPITTKDQAKGWTHLADELQRTWSRGLLARAHTRVAVVGGANINPDERYIVVCNHGSYFDVPCLFASLPLSLRFVAKKELLSVPMFGTALENLGHVIIDRSLGLQAYQKMRRDVEEAGTSVCIFPEGTRSKDGSMARFKSGAFYMAKETGFSVLPVAISGTYNIMPPWRTWLKTDQTVYVDVGAPISPEGKDVATLRDESRRVISSMLRHP